MSGRRFAITLILTLAFTSMILDLLERIFGPVGGDPFTLSDSLIVLGSFGVAAWAAYFLTSNFDMTIVINRRNRK